jgi:hypothetical protein
MLGGLKTDMTLSIDLGVKHLAYSLFDPDMKLMDFGLLETDLTNKGIIERISIVKDFLSSFQIKRLIVEKQTPLNPVCFAMMYCFPACFDGLVVISDPKTKFKKLQLKYNLAKKQHKKQAVEVVKSFLNENQLKKFNEFKKKDDIADSILQAITIS